MDDQYVCEHLKKWCALWYKKGTPFAIKSKKTGNYVFGTKNKRGFTLHKNTVTRPVALTIVVSRIEYIQKKYGNKNRNKEFSKP
ncbi:MAG: hypothetical protein ACOC2U_00120 [bacterium]